MTTQFTPQAAAAATATQPLPDGDDERVVGFGVMGMPFTSGHYLAYRDGPCPHVVDTGFVVTPLGAA